METSFQSENRVIQLMRSAFGRIARPALWKRRRELRLCETLSLGNRNFLAIVGYRDRRFLIAGTTHSISLVADVTAAPVADAGCEKGEVSAA